MKMLMLAGAAMAQPSVPPADRFCEDVRTIAAGAAEADPFRSLRDRNYQPRLDRLACFFTAAGGYNCFHTLARPNETPASYATRIMVCLPGATRTAERRDNRDLIMVRSGALEARIDQSGADNAHVGRRVTVFFAARR